ncbi:hypothetical protein [Parafrigoribacterium soli]|uniref:hypothetical protein n=1 Tax=Parafrigoribacterium soli TaxID=3144663 RepID=UPI0032F03DB1
MTAWQDQPLHGESAQDKPDGEGQQPQSRRQLRLREQREDTRDGGQTPQRTVDAVFANPATADGQSVGASIPPSHDGRHGLRTHGAVDTQDVRLEVAEPSDPQIETFARWDAPAPHRASEDESSAVQQPRSRAEAALASGRRSQRGTQPSEGEAPSASSEERPIYRIRDFRPESRRSAFSSTSELSPSDWGRPGAAGEPANLDYYTQQRPTPVAQTEPAEAGGSEASAHSEEPAAALPEVAESEIAAADSAAADDSSAAEDSESPEAPARGARIAFPWLRTPAPSVPAPETAPVAAADDAAAQNGTAQNAPAQNAPAQNVTAQNAPAQNVTAQPTAAQDASAGQPQQAQGGRPLTRRELRALRESSAPQADAHALQEPETPAQPEAQSQQAPQIPPPLQSPAAPEPQSPRQLSSALAEFDALMGRAPSEAPAPLRSATVQPAAEAETAATPAPSALPVPTPDLSAPKLVAPWSLPQAGSDDVADGPVSAASATSAASTGLENAASDSSSASSASSAASADSTTAGGEAPEAIADASRPFAVPTGHWSTQAAADDDDAESVTLTRNIGVTSGSVTANHLVISSVPNAKDLLLPFSPTGEIMVTGTIDLPRSFGTTGAHPAKYDHSDVDALLEASDREDSDVDSAPVRAIRAVSTHTSSRGLIGTGKPPRSSKLPMVLAVSTAGLATVVVVLFVAGFVLHLF